MALKPHDTIYAILALAKDVRSRAKQNETPSLVPTGTPNAHRPPPSPVIATNDHETVPATATTEREFPRWDENDY